MNVNQLFTGTPSQIIERLKDKKTAVPSWGKLVKEYDPTRHKIATDNVSRRDKYRKDGAVEPASRIYIGLEKLLASRTNEFMFALPVKRIYTYDDKNEVQKAIVKAIEAIYKQARIDSENKRRGIAYFASCESFTIWYTKHAPNTLYGFNSDYKLKCKTFSPMDKVELYPLFDEYEDMIAMSMQYCHKDFKNKDIVYFETYTEDRHIKWIQQSGVWEEVINEKISIKKIPGIYLWRKKPIWEGLSHLREEIEYTLSRNSDVIAYNSAPILKIIGDLQGREEKGETQRVYRVEPGGDINYVSWAQSNDALRYQVSQMLNLFWTQGQMPDVSFDQMKSLGNIGYDARQTLFMDAHLKVGDESGAWIEAFEREANVVKAFLKQMNQEWQNEIDNVEIEHVISPFIQNNEAAEIDKWTKANGGKPVISQLESIQNLGISNNPAQTMEQINKELSESMVTQMKSVMESYE